MTVNTQEQKRLLTDLDVSMRTSDCPYTVTFYGALFREGDVWICMECMDTSLDKFYLKAYEHGRSLEEDVLGEIAFAVCTKFNLLNCFVFQHYCDFWVRLYLHCIIFTAN